MEGEQERENIPFFVVAKGPQVAPSKARPPIGRVLPASPDISLDKAGFPLVQYHNITRFFVDPR